MKRIYRTEKLINSLASSSYFATRWLLVGLPESPGGPVRNSPLSTSFYHGSQCSYITFGMNNRPVGGRSSETWSHAIDMIIIIYEGWSNENLSQRCWRIRPVAADQVTHQQLTTICAPERLRYIKRYTVKNRRSRCRVRSSRTIMFDSWSWRSRTRTGRSHYSGTHRNLCTAINRKHTGGLYCMTTFVFMWPAPLSTDDELTLAGCKRPQCSAEGVQSIQVDVRLPISQE
jgi:hypothetical protein